MSLYDYERSKAISAQNEPFYALIMATMRQADTDNLAKLKNAFPEIWEELAIRYNRPAGLLPEEIEEERRKENREKWARENMTSEQRIDKAIQIAYDYGQIDGDHHKAWVIDQMVRTLVIGKGYDQMIRYGSLLAKSYATNCS